MAQIAALPGATTFTRAYAAASWSLPAYASIFTGRSALNHGVGFTRSSMDSGERTLAEILTIYGYKTQAFCSSSHLHPSLGLSRGFEGYQHTLPLTPLMPQVTAALSWLDARAREPSPQPFFLFVQGYDAHAPYPAHALLSGIYEEEGEYCQHRGCKRNCFPGVRSTDWRCAQLSPEEAQSSQGIKIGHVMAHYDTAVYAADYQLGRLLHGLSERGLLEDAIVIVLADHGEGLGEKGVFAHDWECGEPIFHIPLVVRMPHTAPPATFEGVVSLDGLLPTLLEHLQIPPLGDIDGHSFLAALQHPDLAPDPQAIARSASKSCYAVTDQEWQATEFWNTQEAPRWTLTHVGQETDESADHPDILARLRVPIEDWPVGMDLEALNQEPAQGNPAIREALQQGGYWSRPEKTP